MVDQTGGAPMISVDIRKALGTFELNVQFQAPAGVTAVFGRSGTGKTSVIRAIAGLDRPDMGRIEIAGRVLFDQDINLPPHRRGIGVVFQDARLFPHLSVARNLTYGGRHDHDRIVELLGLGPLLTRYPAHLSGGEAQRVALGRALMSNPRILLLDEPLAALDATRKADVLPYLERLRDTVDVPMIYVSHAVSEVARLATTLVVLDAGHVVQSGPLEDVLSDPKSMRIVGVRDAGAVINAKVERHDDGDGLSVLAFDGGMISMPKVDRPVGTRMRLRVPAQDVILARLRPQQISARNVVAVRVTELDHGRGTGVAVGLRAGKTPLLARITKASLREMDLAVGDEIFAILKATAAAPENIGQGRG